MGEMIYHGKVKQVWTTEDPDIIEFRYTNQISVFDQVIPSLVPGKGESLNRTSCHWFELVEQENICETHVIEMTRPDRVRARRFDVVHEPGIGRMSSFPSRSSAATTSQGLGGAATSAAKSVPRNSGLRPERS